MRYNVLSDPGKRRMYDVQSDPRMRDAFGGGADGVDPFAAGGGMPPQDPFPFASFGSRRSAAGPPEPAVRRFSARCATSRRAARGASS